MKWWEERKHIFVREKLRLDKEWLSNNFEGRRKIIGRGEGPNQLISKLGIVGKPRSGMHG